MHEVNIYSFDAHKHQHYLHTLWVKKGPIPGLVWRMSRFSISAYYRSGVGDSRLICLLSGGRFCYLSMALFMPWRTTYPHPDNLLGFYNSFKDPCFLVKWGLQEPKYFSSDNSPMLSFSNWEVYHEETKREFQYSSIHTRQVFVVCAFCEH